MSVLKKIFGDTSSKALKEYRPIVEQINALEPEITALSDDALRAKTDEFKKRLGDGETEDDLLVEAFAVVREAAQRTLGQRHYDVQLIGGIALHKGNIAEMKTGEGKTLVGTCPAYLNALSGKGVHVVTVNDYLSRRDAVWMGQVFAFLGLTVGVVNSQNQSFLYNPDEQGTPEDEERDEEGSFKVVYEFLTPCSKNEAYRADITYGTNNEFGFDYLRDNTAYTRKQLNQRAEDEGGYHYAIVDEIDSILIDEARTPLIIAMPQTKGDDLYGQFSDIARRLKKDEHFTVDEKLRAVELTDEGIEAAERALGVENIYTEKGIKYVHHLETAVKAHALYTKDKEYVVHNGEVVIVDENTGRMQPGRRWSEGLHQAIEAKEGVSIQQESKTAASVTYQNYFRMYDKLSGMTGTAESSAEEFYKVYGLETIVIPTHRPIARRDLNDLIFQTEKGKFVAIAKTVKELHEKGQPVLVGTVAVEDNERLAAFLRKEGVPHEMLNAKNHEREGEIVAEAGKRGAVTIATNMAGRGVDIKLGGPTATDQEQQAIKDLGGLFVLGTERHDARRIDNQLRGRSGRQGDPGTTQFFVSLDDKLMRVFATDTVRALMSRMDMPEDEAIENRIITRSLETAQRKIEGLNFDGRKHVLEYDDVLNTQRQSTYARRRTLLLGDAAAIEATLAEYVLDDTEAEAAIATKKEELGDEQFVAVVRRLMLQMIDMFWIEHLETMDYLRSSVRLRAYGQRDPLVEYRKEGRRLFEQMEDSVRFRVLELIPRIQLKAFEQNEEELKKQRESMQEVNAESAKDTQSKKQAPIEKSDEDKVGRNDLCPCGSGKKYKKCGMIDAPEHNRQ